MKYLLDTSIFLWAASAPEKLTREVNTLLRSGGHEFYLSAAGSWEIGLKYAAGKLKLPSPPAIYVPGAMRDLAIRALPIELEHTYAAAALPPNHNDPFDRMHVAQAQLEAMTLMTADKMLAKYPASVLWSGR
jgi:PIN domain nuclease of toxin-antitoxin system